MADIKHEPYHAFVNSMTRCYICNNKVVLLCKKTPEAGNLGEGFYICFHCMLISQVGVGNLNISGKSKLKKDYAREEV